MQTLLALVVLRKIPTDTKNPSNQMPCVWLILDSEIPKVPYTVTTHGQILPGPGLLKPLGKPTITAYNHNTK